MRSFIFIVTGAPGAGKSTTLTHFLRRQSSFIAFDMDWLVEAASSLAGTDIRFAPSTWKSYTELWFEVVHAIHRNEQTPVLLGRLTSMTYKRMDSLPGIIGLSGCFWTVPMIFAVSG